ncbi:unnamed protein product [Cuscuta europaea]|nr:unnamed protein product [Cuscuta europaea]
MMFAFTSLGGKIQKEVNNSRGPYVYRMHGQNYRLMGSLLPMDSGKSKFSQLYIYDTENEIPNKLHALESDQTNKFKSKKHPKVSTCWTLLGKRVFPHGQLYVVVSRVKSRNGLKILLGGGEGCNTTTNVVYKEVFQNV